MKLSVHSRFLLVVILAVGLPACQALNPAEIPPPTMVVLPTATVTPAPTLTATQTIAPSPTPTITPTPTPLVMVEAGTPLPDSLPAISPTNANQVSGLATWQDAAITDLAWNPVGNTLVVASEDAISLYDPITRTKLRSLEPDTPGVAVIGFDPSGNWLAAGIRTGTVETGFNSDLQLWFGEDLNPVGILYSSQQAISDLTFSPAGNLFAAAYSGVQESLNGVDFWNPATWTITGTLKTSVALQAAFSPGGSLLAITPNRYAIQVWDLADSGKRVFNLPTSFSGAVNALAFAPSGLTLASGHYDGRIIIWDLFTGAAVMRMQSPGVIESLAFNADGSLLATGSGFEDQSIRLWNPTTGALLQTLPGHSSGVNQLAFSPNGQYLASGSYDGMLRLWGIRP